MPDAASHLVFRRDVSEEDSRLVRELCESTRFFHAYEVDVAVELVVERLSKGTASGYEFVFATLDGETVGYACFGPIACTKSSYDLYWLVVGDRWRGRGYGRALLYESERLMRSLGATRLYAETSSREQYKPTRAFYERCGFRVDALLEDFYDAGDGKVIYVKSR